MPSESGLTTNTRLRGFQRHFRLHMFNGRDRMRVNDGVGFTNAGIDPWVANIKTAVLTSNVVTITTASVHRLASNATVSIHTSSNNAVYSGTYVITVTSTTAFTYARTNDNISTADVGGTVRVIPTLAKSGTGPTGTYTYFVAPVNRNKALPASKYVAGNPTPMSGTLTVANQGIAISGIPTTHPDSQVTHWALYRNKTGNHDSFLEDETLDYWLVDYVAIGTSTYTDRTKGNDLSNIAISFRNDAPPCFKGGAEFDGKLLGCGYDPITSGTVTVNANTCLLDFTTVTLPDGVAGLKFKADGDDVEYTIAERISTTQVCLETPYVGALSGASYSIYFDPTSVWVSEWDNWEAGGKYGAGLENNLFIGGPGAVDPITAIAALTDEVFVFTRNDIYLLYGRGFTSSSMKAKQDPIVRGIGCVGFDAVWREGEKLYFMSDMGPMAFDGRNIEHIHRKLGTSWLDDLNPAQLAICATGSDGRLVKFAAPLTGETENGRVFTYDLHTGTWWEERYVHPKFYFQDLNSSGDRALFYAQGKFIVEDGVGTNDGVPSGTVSGTVTTGGTTSFTASAASFYTTGSGLPERYVHVYRAGALVGRRRIISNTGTALTWSATGSGGGSLTVAIGDTFEVAPIDWVWKTRDFTLPAKTSKKTDLYMRWLLQGETTPSNITKTDFIDGVEAGTVQTKQVKRTAEQMPVQKTGVYHAFQIESRETDADLCLRDINIDGLDPVREK